jgi:hypothetical protein
MVSSCFLETFYIHDHELGFTVLGDDQRLSALCDAPDDFGGMALQIADGFDL